MECLAMGKDNDSLKAEMISAIRSGGAWFSTRENNYLKIADSGEGGRLCARECIVNDGAVSGRAYTFGNDWFDISFHGRLVDIYVDPDTLKVWDEEELNGSGKLAAFCRQADSEALAGNMHPYHIDGAPFAENLMPSEARMGRKDGILSKIDIAIVDGKKVPVTREER